MLFAAPAGGGNDLLLPGIIILLMVAMYFFMIRPQNKRRKEMMEKQRQAGPGESIVTIGGLHATIIDADDTTVTLEVSPGIMCVYERGAIARVVEDDTAAPEATAVESTESTESIEDTPETAADAAEGTTDEKSDEASSTVTKPSGSSKPMSDGTQN